MDAKEDGFPTASPDSMPKPKRGLAWWWYLLIGLGLMLFTSIAALCYVGFRGPDTKVYVGNEVPRRFVATIRELGMLEEKEKLRYFYSSALIDIRDGFCFVSDRKVGIYDPEAESPVVQVAFDEIEKAELESSDSWVLDGAITLSLKEGDLVAFDVSSELGRDKMFLAAIREGMERGQKTEG
jgi:hypothetical protein